MFSINIDTIASLCKSMFCIWIFSASLMSLSFVKKSSLLNVYYYVVYLIVSNERGNSFSNIMMCIRNLKVCLLNHQMTRKIWVDSLKLEVKEARKRTLHNDSSSGGKYGLFGKITCTTMLAQKSKL